MVRRIAAKTMLIGRRVRHKSFDNSIVLPTLPILVLFCFAPFRAAHCSVPTRNHSVPLFSSFQLLLHLRRILQYPEIYYRISTTQPRKPQSRNHQPSKHPTFNTKHDGLWNVPSLPVPLRWRRQLRAKRLLPLQMPPVRPPPRPLLWAAWTPSQTAGCDVIRGWW